MAGDATACPGGQDPAALADVTIPRPAPFFRFAYPPSLEDFNVAPSAYLSKHFPPMALDGIGTAALVFDDRDRFLLLRRAAHDSMPGMWEPPGGAADETDGSLFGACARELWEEAGLVARRIVRVVSEGEDRLPGSRFTNRTGERVFVKFGFEVDVESADAQTLPGQRAGPAPRMDPNEHDAFVWASEEEVRSGRIEGLEGHLELTYGATRDVIYDAFRRRRDEEAEAPSLWYENGTNDGEVDERDAVSRVA